MICWEQPCLPAMVAKWASQSVITKSTSAGFSVKNKGLKWVERISEPSAVSSSPGSQFSSSGFRFLTWSSSACWREAFSVHTLPSPALRWKPDPLPHSELATHLTSSPFCFCLITLVPVSLPFLSLLFVGLVLILCPVPCLVQGVSF